MAGKYIVIFKKTASADEVNKYADEVGANGGLVKDRWDSSAMKGFSAEIPESFLTQLQSLAGNGPIDYIEPDGTVTIQ